MSMNGVSSFTPYAGYPYNATGATPVTKDIGSHCFDTQRPNIEKTNAYLMSDNKQNYTWPIIGTAVSALSLLTVIALKRKP